MLISEFLELQFNWVVNIFLKIIPFIKTVFSSGVFTTAFRTRWNGVSCVLDQFFKIFILDLLLLLCLVTVISWFGSTLFMLFYIFTIKYCWHYKLNNLQNTFSVNLYIRAVYIGIKPILITNIWQKLKVEKKTNF